MPKSRPAALVTGGAKGIGRAIARHLLAPGWSVGIGDLPGSGLGRAFPPLSRNIALIVGDVTTEETARRAAGTMLEKFGRLDALVSNAGIMRRKPLRRLTAQDWHRVIDVNLTATYLLVRAAERP